MSLGLFSRRDLQKRRSQSSRIRKFNYDKFINDYYIDDDGYAYISAKVSGMGDIVSEYSIKGYDWIDPDFTAYVEESFYYIPLEEKVCLEICGHKFTDKEKERIKKLISNYYGLRLGDIKLDLNTNTKRIVMMLLVGLLSFIVYWIVAAKTNTVLGVELVPILFWCFLENGIDMIIYERSDILEKRDDALQLANMVVKFDDEELVPEHDDTVTE